MKEGPICAKIGLRQNTFFQWHFQFTEWLQFWCMRSCTYEKRPDLGENQTSTSERGIMSYRLHPLPNHILVWENRFSRSEPKRCLERTQLLPMLHLPCNWFLISEDCHFIIFYWCNPWLCKAKTKTSTNHAHASEYLQLFPRMFNHYLLCMLPLKSVQFSSFSWMLYPFTSFQACLLAFPLSSEESKLDRFC